MRFVKMLIVASLLCILTTARSVTAEDTGNDLKQFLQSRLALAETLLKDEQYSKAVAIADALLTLKPDAAFEQEVKNFRDRALEAQTQSEVLQCEIVPEKKIYLAGDAVRVAIRLYNRGLNEVTIPLKEKAGAKPDKSGKVPQEPNRLMLAALFDDYTALGSSRKDTTKSWDEDIKDEITLAPGDFWEKIIEPEGLTDGIGGRMARKVSFSVTFAPLVAIEGGKKRFITPYHAEAYAFMVLPKEAADVVPNPEESLKRALRDGDDAAIFHASMVLSQANRNLALRLLTAALRNARPNSAVESAIIVGMQHSLGFYGRRTREAWLTWWDKAWTYYCTDVADESGAKIALMKTGGSYLITLDGEQLPLANLVERLRESLGQGVTKAEIRCGKDVAFAQFMELYQAVRSTGIHYVSIVYAEAGAP